MQEYWSGLPVPSLRELPNPAIKTTSLTFPASQAGSLPLVPPGKAPRFLMYMCMLVVQSCPTLCDPMKYTAHQAPLSMEFSRQEYQSGLPFSSPGDLLNPVEPRSPALEAESLPYEPPGKPRSHTYELIHNICFSFWH